ncbi:MAG: DUF1800 domain-containing protein [Chitinophagaceae bacterium]|nr:DUF1800 domain-containing protein [Chitinophagaceae bacterium]
MSITNFQKNQHLLWRAGFGIDLQNLNQLQHVETKDLYTALQKNCLNTIEYFDVADNALKGLFKGIDELAKMQTLAKNGLNNETKKKLREQSREDIKNLNIKWVNEMVHGANPLNEKMALFWHGHFACRDINIFFQQNLLHEIRTLAVTNFKDLLFAVSKSASMLSFLNNQQNKKQHPNENFAREVMELFTLGRGNYTEQDVKEAARAFTGWGFNAKGEFQFRPFFHDSGTKTFLGKKGNFNGDDILNILLDQPQTAYFITKKIYEYFVNEIIDDEKVKQLASAFYQSNYSISTLLENIFTSPWFYHEKNIGTKIKSPIELLVGIRKQIPMEIENPEIQLLLQRALGQLLFYPPNVAGWPGGKNWIDSSSLMIRLQLPKLLKDDESFTINTKSDDDQQMGMREMYSMQTNMPNRFKIKTKIDWEKFIDAFSGIKREELTEKIKQFILPSTVSKINNKTVEKFSDQSSRENFIKSCSITFMSTPEYQMC